jgi:hypothetical protein
MGALMRPDEHDRWRDERAADLRERDRQREPQHRHPRCVAPNPLVPRQAFQARMQDALNEDNITHLVCPTCNGPVFVPRDSDRELVDCAGPTCRARLVTRRAIEGLELVLDDGGSK